MYTIYAKMAIFSHKFGDSEKFTFHLWLYKNMQKSENTENVYKTH